MKVALFIDTYYPTLDGVYKVVDNYARRLACKCDEVVVYGPKVAGWKESDDEKTFPYKIKRCNSFFYKKVNYFLPFPHTDIPFLRELLKQDYDIVHIHSPFPLGLTGVQYSKIKKVPIVATLHSQYKQDFKKTFKGKLIAKIAMWQIMSVFNRCTECWAVNDDIRKLYLGEYGLKVPARVQLNATDHKAVSDPVAAAAEVNKLYGLKEDEKVFLFIGRITFIKNIDFIVRSLSILKEKGHSFKMLFVGTGAHEKKLAKLIKSLNLEDCIMMCGEVSDVSLLEKIYSRADLFLFPSLYDSNSIVQIEAACQRTPTVFLEGARTACTITDNVNGYIVSPKTEEAYANRIIEIFSDKEAYEKVCDAAQRDIYKNWDDIVDEVYARYEELIAKNKELKKAN
ncbi:MAG: glycosyltransferase [Bacteroidales bacterium]|nr:glycosyltransferase [Bacteroidales bacterium]